jgi:tetratricopeptide (TPR) repeat protein
VAHVNGRRWIAVFLAGGLACTIVPARAQETPASTEIARAEAFATEAFEAYSRKDYEQAVELYLKALEASPSADIVYNLARIYDSKLKDRKQAIAFYQRYTQDTGADPSRVRAANQRLQELRELENAANEPPASQKAAAAAATQVEAPAPSPKSPPPSAASQGGLTATQVAGLITGAAGLAGLGVGIGFGIAAKSDSDVAHELCDGNACSTQEGVDAAQDASRSATVSTVAFIAGGALTALGVTLLIVGARGEDERAVSVAPALGHDLLGAVARGTF